MGEKKIIGEIVSHGRSRKIVVFKFKRRKGYQTKNTHRSEYTILKFGKLGTAKIPVKKVVTKKSTVKKTVTKKTAPSKPKESKE